MKSVVIILKHLIILENILFAAIKGLSFIILEATGDS